jgi:subtilase family serine protease
MHPADRRRRGTRLLVAVAAAGLAAVGAAPHAAAAVADPYLGLSGTRQVTTDILGGIDRFPLTGVIDPHASMQIGVSLSRPDPAGENAYLADVYNPSSAHFRDFLDPAGFQSRFGVSSERYAKAVAWLKAGGLAVTQVPGDSEYLLAEGPSSSVEALFATPVDTFRYSGTDFYANTKAPTVPADLGVLGVAGLQSYVHMYTDKQLDAAALAHGGAPARPAAVGPGTNTGITTPQDLWSIYDQPASNRGAGESMAIFGWGATESDGVDVTGNLRTFEATYHLPQIPIKVTEFGTGPHDTNGTGEWELDLPASTGMAPDATQEHLYFGVNGQDPDILAAFNGWNGDANGPRQGSASFAGCEASPLTGSQAGGPGNPAGTVIIGNPNQDAYEAALKQAVMLGRTLFNSAGDLGPNGCPVAIVVLNGVTPVPVQLNDYPSSSGWVTTVGGTVLYWNGDGDTGATPATRALEYSWTFTGGGTSYYISSPPWQNGAFSTDSQSSPGLTGLCLTDWHNPPTTYAPGTFCRGLPDVAAQSGDVATNGYVAGAGTSLSSPLWLGMWTRVQAASSKPGRLGFASPAIYANNHDATKWARDFFDIGDPTNTSTVPTCSGIVVINNCSKPGWDYLSGWGTPDVKNLMQDLAGGTVPVAAGPTVTVPEAPATALLALGGAAIVVGVVLWRRRRGAPRA